jgi:hypothetical protein
MTLNDIKLYSLNLVTMILSFTNIENFLKIILLFLSIAYTVMKISELIKNKDEGKGTTK